jgi:hypothetical protein
MELNYEALPGLFIFITVWIIIGFFILLLLTKYGRKYLPFLTADMFNSNKEGIADRYTFWAIAWPAGLILLIFVGCCTPVFYLAKIFQKVSLKKLK